jgi:CxxC motif-containing protein (DUF1111 family)
MMVELEMQIEAILWHGGEAEKAKNSFPNNR